MPDYFGVFGLPRRLGIDRTALERRFYELSREMHPDRFASAGPERVRQAVEQMSALNEAYGTLKDPAQLRQYFLQLEGFASEAASKSAIPAELAESWFELQDVMMEEPARAPGLIAEFERQLAGLRERSSAALLALERELDAQLAVSPVVSGGAISRDQLQQLADAIREQSYFKSLERDVERLRARLKSGGAGAGA